MRAYTVSHVVGHADVDGRALLVQKPVDARRGGQRLKIAGRHVLRQPRFAFPALEHARHHVSGALRGHHAVEQFHCRGTIAHGAVPGFVADAKVFADAAKAVAGVTGEELASHAHRAQLGTAPDTPHGLVMAADERIVEPHVVCHEHAATQEFFQLVRNGFKRRCRLDHVVRNPSELRDVQWNGQAGVDERFPPFDFRGAIGNDRGNLGDAVAFGMGAGGFDINDGVARHGAKFGIHSFVFGSYLCSMRSALFLGWLMILAVACGESTPAPAEEVPAEPVAAEVDEAAVAAKAKILAYPPLTDENCEAFLTEWHDGASRESDGSGDQIRIR